MVELRSTPQGQKFPPFLAPNSVPPFVALQKTSIIRICLGQFVIRNFRILHEFDRFRVFSHSNRYCTDMGARPVLACQNESSETT